MDGVQGVHDGMDEMKARGINPNVFTYFVLREASILENDQRTATSALESINTLIKGDMRSLKGGSLASEDSDEASDKHAPEKLAPEESSTHHWKGYYASDDDEW